MSGETTECRCKYCKTIFGVESEDYKGYDAHLCIDCQEYISDSLHPEMYLQQAIERKDKLLRETLPQLKCNLYDKRKDELISEIQITKNLIKRIEKEIED